MNHQDWKPIVLNKDNQKSTKKSGPSEDFIRMKKIENDEYVIPKVSVALQQQIRDARASKGMTQKDLAAQLNIKAAIINGYESGSIVPDNKILQRMSRILGVQLKLK